jgi:hypothetical protein
VKSSVPIRVSTLFGVTSDEGMFVVSFIFGACAIAAAPDNKIRQVAAPSFNASLPFMMGTPVMMETRHLGPTPYVAERTLAS